MTVPYEPWPWMEPLDDEDRDASLTDPGECETCGRWRRPLEGCAACEDLTDPEVAR